MGTVHAIWPEKGASSPFLVYATEDYWHTALQQGTIVLLSQSTMGLVGCSIVDPFTQFGFWGVDNFELLDAPERHTAIEQNDLPEGEPYTMLRPIPVKVVHENEIDFIASFQEANLAIGGITFHDAVQALILEILDTFDYLDGHVSELGPAPEEQLRVLRTYIVKAQR